MAGTTEFGEYFEEPIDGGPLPGGQTHGNPPPVVAGRYRLGATLGAGSHGQVYRAVDLLTSDAVAVKFLSPGVKAARLVRREAVALRGLRIPGVVHLLDDGEVDGRPFLVMELVEGSAFPGIQERPAAWSAFCDAALSVFEALGRIHAAGVLHLDLKPPNVQILPDGRAVLLDLGMAGGPALGGAAPARCTGGTLRYMAPEQLNSGRVDGRTDLYAVGVMIYETLTAAQPPPPHHSECAAVDRQLRERWPELPARIYATIACLLAADPAARPQSAWQAIDRMQGDSQHRRQPDLPGPRRPGPLAIGDLEGLFCGPERILHLRSDAARALHRRTRGDEGAIGCELRRWLRLGVAESAGQCLRVERATLEWLEQIDALNSTFGDPGDNSAHRQILPVPNGPPDPTELVRLIAGQAHDLAPAAERVARSQLEQGRPDQARLALEQGLFAIRRGDGRIEQELALLSLWSQMAIDERNPAGLQLALYHTGRACHRTSQIEALEQLLRASLHAEQREAARAADFADSLPPFSEPELELRRHAVRLRAASLRSTEEEEAVLREAQAWVRQQKSPRARTRLLSWLGRLRYRQGRFGDSAVLHEQSVECAVSAVEQLSSSLNGASSMMEAGNYQAARAFARDALDLSRRYRLPLDEGRAEWLLRAIAYRSGHGELQPDIELVDAAERVGVRYLVALIAINEAAVAWRGGDWVGASELARRASNHFTAADIRGGCAVAQALEMACASHLAGSATGPQPTVQVISALVRDMLDRPIDDIDWQVVGLLASLPTGAAWRETAIQLAGAAPDPDRRRELLAPREVLHW